MRFSWKLFLLALPVLIFAGCKSYSLEEQEKLAQLYYSGKVDAAANLATEASEKLAGKSNQEALLWHLEAGSVNLDAGRYPDAIAALNRAEKMIYLLDGQGNFAYQRPGMVEYSGSRSDRLMLHLLKGFYYLSQNSLEDALVEIRRLRAGQFRYILQEADKDVLNYEQKNFGKRLAPLRMTQLLQDSSSKSIFNQMDVRDAYTEYQQLRRPQLPLFCNPIAFYLSSLGYCFDREYQDAALDMRYLVMFDSKNRLYQEDYAALCRVLGDEVPREVAQAARGAVPDDQVVCIIWASGKPDGWFNVAKTYHLPGCVPTDWKLAAPVFTASSAGEFSAGWRDTPHRSASKLVDLSEVTRDEYWQQTFPQLVQTAKNATYAMTVAHDAALANLAAARAISDSTARSIAIASASAAVAATSRTYLNNSEWRCWVTLPRHYYAMHLPLPAEPGKRILLIDPPATSRHSKPIRLQFSPDTNRAIVYIREIFPGKIIVKKWESNE